MPEDVDRFDLGAVRLARELAQAAEVAARQAAAPPPVAAARPVFSASTAPHARLLDVCAGRPLRPSRFPAPELVAPHSPELAEAIGNADLAQRRARDAASAWEATEPGSAAFAAALTGCSTEGEIVTLLTTRPATAFAAAWLAQQDAKRVDEQVRVQARDAGALRAMLDTATDELVVEIRGLFERARDDKSRRHYDEAVERAQEWRELVRLWRWLADPTRAYEPPVGRGLPGDCEWAEHEAAVAIGEQRHEVPIDAADSPYRRPAAQPDVVLEPRRRGLFRRDGE